jgi:hypothetical protein
MQVCRATKLWSLTPRFLSNGNNSKIRTKLEANGNIIEETEKFQYLG